MEKGCCKRTKEGIVRPIQGLERPLEEDLEAAQAYPARCVSCTAYSALYRGSNLLRYFPCRITSSLLYRSAEIVGGIKLTLEQAEQAQAAVNRQRIRLNLW